MRNHTTIFNHAVMTFGILVSTLLLGCATGDLPDTAEIKRASEVREVTIRQDNAGYTLLVDGKPYFIKGAVGTGNLAQLKEHGANSVRIWRNHRLVLDDAHRLGLTALISLPVKAERRGMDYDDPEMVQAQFDEIMALVESIKDHPAILMWAIGNELDFVPGSETYKPSVWNAVNDIAKAIKATDPNHPVMTVVGTGRFHKLRELRRRAPDLDLLGVNTYADMPKMPAQLDQYGWAKPYVFTEWGVSGYWQVPKASWGAPYEENTTMKAIEYRRKYEDVVLNYPGQCLGSYVFLWGWKQETTHTWFGMLDHEGRESEAVDVMHELWTGEKPGNLAPAIENIVIEGSPYLEDFTADPGSTYVATVRGIDPDGDALVFEWEIRPEADYADYAGQGEQTPPTMDDLIIGSAPAESEAGQTARLSFRAPSRPGPYRVYAYAYDGHNHYATANRPFWVAGEGDAGGRQVTDYGD